MSGVRIPTAKQLSCTYFCSVPGCIFLFGVVMLAQGFGELTNQVASQVANNSNSDYIQWSVGNEVISWASRSWSLPRKLVASSTPNNSIFNQLAGFYLISTYYKREESQKRFTAYYCSTLVAAICGGLLASAIAKMDGIRSLHNWRWIFILEGIFTIIVGIFSLFLVAEFPEDAKWLSNEERKFVIARAKCTDQIDQITPRVLLVFFKDPKNTLAAIMYFCKFGNKSF